MTITERIPAKDGYNGLTEAEDASGRTWVVCGTGPSAVEALRGAIEREESHDA